MSFTVLSTKKLAKHQKEPLLNSVIGLVEQDFISIVPIPFEIKKIPENVIFTSKNAVKAILTHPKILEIQTKDILCVGDKTAEFLNKHNFRIVEKVNYGRDLAEKIVQNYDSEEFFFFCGKNRHPELPKKLKANNIELKEVEVYDTELIPKKIDRIFDGILFFSPSAVKSYCSKNGIFESVPFCIGKTTATEAEKHSDKIVIATKPSIENLIVQVVKHFRGSKN